MLREGQIRIPSGCAISGIFSRAGKRDERRADHCEIHGNACMTVPTAWAADLPDMASIRNIRIIMRSMFFMMTTEAKETCEAFLERHFEIINLSKIPTRKTPGHYGRAADLALFCARRCPPSWRTASWMKRNSWCACVIRINTTYRGRLRIFQRQKHGRIQGGGLSGGCRRVLPAGRICGLLLDGAWPVSDQYAGLVGRRASLCACWTTPSCITERSPPTTPTAAISKCLAINARC